MKTIKSYDDLLTVLRSERSQNIARLGSLMFGSVITGGGILHMWFHSTWGKHDWTAFGVIVLGAGIAFNREVISLIKAWRAK
jgi:hypothetical protein